MSITLPTSRSRALALILVLPLALLAACGDDDVTADGGGRAEDSGNGTDSGGGEDTGVVSDTGTGTDTSGDDDGGGACVPSIEICGDRIDQNCDGRDTSCGDSDNDRVDACRAGDDLTMCDCDDESADVYPGHPEICDGLDNDCNGRVDEVAACCAGCSAVGERGDICATSGECECSTAPGRAVCAEGQVCCGNGCSDISSDINNCGFCGTACDPGTDRCTAGQCRCGTDQACDNDRTCTAGSCG